MTRPMKILEKQKQPSFRTLSYSKKKKKAKKQALNLQSIVVLGMSFYSCLKKNNAGLLLRLC